MRISLVRMPSAASPPRSRPSSCVASAAKISLTLEAVGAFVVSSRNLLSIQRMPRRMSSAIFEFPRRQVMRAWMYALAEESFCKAWTESRDVHMMLTWKQGPHVPSTRGQDLNAAQ